MSEDNLTDIEKLDEIISDFKREATIFYRVRLELEELIDKYEKIVSEIPYKQLNTLISFGFIPKARFRFNGEEITFCGYTKENGMMFKHKNEKMDYSDIKSVYNNLDKFQHID